MRSHDFFRTGASVCQFLEQPTAPDAIPPEVKETIADWGKLLVDLTTGLLMHEATIDGTVVRVPYPAPRDRHALLQAMHSIPSAGHLGRQKMQSRIRQRNYWKGLGSDVKAFIQYCHACQVRKQHQPKKAGNLLQFSATYPFQVVGVDILGPLPSTLLGNRYVVVIVDRFSRWVELTAVPDILAETIADVVVNQLIFRHGCPTQLLTDRGSQFTSL